MTPPLNVQDDQGRLIVGLLARERALFRPFRAADWASGSTGARYELQQEFRQHGLRWSEGGDPAARQAAGRRLTAAVDGGLVEVHGRPGRRTHVRLSDQGRRLAEALADVPTLADGRRAVRKVLRFAPAEHLVSELLPAKVPDYEVPGCEKKLADFQWCALPAIVAGWLESESDQEGRVAYRVTSAGAEAVRRRLPKPRGLPAALPELAEVFDAEYQAERERLLAARPTDGEIGPIPLAVGGWSELLGPWSTAAADDA